MTKSTRPISTTLQYKKSLYRLMAKHGYIDSYSIVQRYLKKCRTRQVEKANLKLI